MKPPQKTVVITETKDAVKVERAADVSVPHAVGLLTLALRELMESEE